MFGRKKRNAKSQNVVPALLPRPNIQYVMPSEETPHEGTWLAWPHNFGWDPDHIQRYESCWIALSRALHTGERVHIIAYNEAEQDRIYRLLLQEGLDDISQVDFYIWPTDDVWVRDYGPIFVYQQQQHTGADDSSKELCITNWLFNGWGGKAEDYYDNYIPLKVGHALGLSVVDIPMVHEGGSMELDGRGTLMAKRSSILNSNRNPGWTQQNAEAYFRHYLGVTNFVWLDGEKNGDITDDHIDGTARFANNGDTIVTFYKEDFVKPKEYKTLQKAVDAAGNPYKMVHLPVTKRKIKQLGDYGIYINYYVGNQVVIVPAFDDDPHDSVAADKLQRLYPDRKIVSINFTEVFRDGGMMHCVTQQQPISPSS